MDWLFGLCGLLMVLVLIMLIGHGMWAVLAWMFRGFRPNTTVLAAPQRVCGTCGIFLPPGMMTCPRCSVAPRTGTLTTEDELHVAARQLRRLSEIGAIGPQMLLEALDAIDGEYQRLAMERMPTRPPPIPPLSVISIDEPLESLQPVAAPVGMEAPGPADFAVAFQEPQAEPQARPPRAFVPPILPRPIIAPRPPRRPFSEVLASFMEQRNIRWGELVGGLLIVGCSVALVLSFWSQIAQRPVLKFSIFTAVTGALFGLGLYTEHRWKLPTTSRGVLLIATLLVPLNFLAFAAFSLSGPVFDVVALTGEGTALVLFLWLLHAAAKVIAPRGPWVMASGVLALSAMSLVVRYVAAPQGGTLGTGGLLGLGTGIVVCYLASALTMLARERRSPAIDLEAGHAVLLFIGVLTFAVVFPLALLLNQSGDAIQAVRRLAPLVAICGIPATSAGLLLWRRISDMALGGLRTAGTAVAVAGALIMMTAIVLAWPVSGAMLPVAVIDSVVLAALAWIYRIPSGHLLAAACAAVAGLLGFHLAFGHVAASGANVELISILLRSDGGVALCSLVALWLASGELSRRFGRVDDARMALLAATGTAAISVAIASHGGFARAGDSFGVAWLYGGYAVAAFAVAWRGLSATAVSPRQWTAGWVGWGLLLAATVQVLASHTSAGDPWTIGSLIFSTFAMAGAVAGARLGPAARRAFARPAHWCATIASIAVAALVLAQFVAFALQVDFAGLGSGNFADLTRDTAWRLAWLATLWLMLAVGRTSRAWFAAGQVALAASLKLTVLAVLARRQWFIHSPAPLLDPWVWQSVGVAPALLALVFSMLRLLLGDAPVREQNEVAIPGLFAGWQQSGRQLLMQRWRVDRLILLSLGIVLLAMGIYAVAPAVAAELSPAGVGLTAALPWVQQSHAAGVGSWVLLGILLVAIAALWRRGIPGIARQGLLVIAWAACPLLAARTDGAGASALRWTIAAWLGMGAVLPILLSVLRRRHAIAGEPAALLGAEGHSQRGLLGRMFRFEQCLLDGEALKILLLLGAFPLVVLSLYPTIAAITGTPVQGPAALSLFARIGPALSYAIPLVLLAGMTIGHAIIRRSNGAALAAMLVLNLAATSGYIIGAAYWTHSDGRVIRLGQINIAVTAAFALAWFSGLWIAGRTEKSDVARPKPLVWSAGIAFLWSVLQVTSASLPMLLVPDGLGAWNGMLGDVGSPLGWVGFVLAAAAFVLVDAPRRERISLAALLPILLTAPALAGVSAAVGWPGTWVGFHIWMYGQTAGAWAMLGLGWWLYRRGAGEAMSSMVGPLVRGQAAGSQESPNALASSELKVGLCEPPPSGSDGLPSADLDSLTSVARISPQAQAVERTPSTASTGRIPEGQASTAPIPIALEYQQPTEFGTQPTVYVGGHDVRRSAARWAFGLGAFAVLLALRAVWNDPAAPWPSVAVVSLISLVAVASAVGLMAPVYLYGAGILTNLAASICYAWTVPLSGRWLAELVAVNVIALATPGLAWLVLELQVFRRSAATRRPRFLPEVHAAAAVISLIAILGLAGFGFALHMIGFPVRGAGWLICGAVASVAALLIGCLWDARGRFASACLYLLGLGGLVLLLDRFNFPADKLAWTGTLLLAGYVLLTCALWSWRGWLSALAQRAGMPAAATCDARPWLVPASIVSAGAVVALAFGFDLALDSTGMRLATGCAALAQAGSIALLCRDSRGTTLRQAAVVTAIAGLIAISWSVISQQADPWWLARTVIVLAILMPMALAGALLTDRLIKRPADWAPVFRRLTRGLIAAAMMAVLAMIGCELSTQMANGAVPMEPLAIGAVILLLGAACSASIWLALCGGTDPFLLSARGRQAYIYAAEALLAAVFTHIRLTMPFLFGGYLQQYWPLVVMAIAFGGVGAGEAFRRRQTAVLAGPLLTTGMFLPLLPVLAFWLVESRIHYSALLASVALLYGTIALIRRSFGFGLLAALFANAGLWYLLYHTESLGLFTHPQLWVIPAALSVLGASELNRAVLSREQVRSLRYATLVAVYVSSTADIFLSGAAHSPWLPMILAVLSVAGVFAGVILRIRPFLFLGTGFLALAIVAMIWNAANNLHWTWLWYVAGILLGGFIIALFGLFEKKRPQMLAMIEGLRAWE